MNKQIIVNTSFDDLRSSFHLINPIERKEIRATVNMLVDNILFEKTNLNRSTVINILMAKIKQLEKKS